MVHNNIAFLFDNLKVCSTVSESSVQVAASFLFKLNGVVRGNNGALYHVC